jgi:hypothetical protein
MSHLWKLHLRKQTSVNAHLEMMCSIYVHLQKLNTCVNLGIYVSIYIDIYT